VRIRCDFGHNRPARVQLISVTVVWNRTKTTPNQVVVVHLKKQKKSGRGSEFGREISVCFGERKLDVQWDTIHV
jgi:hypothetical protein